MTRRGVTQAAGCHPAILSKRFQTWSLGRPLCILNTYHSLYARLCARPQDTSMIMGPTVQREVMVSHTPALDCWISRTFCSILDTTSQVTDRRYTIREGGRGSRTNRIILEACPHSIQEPHGLRQIPGGLQLNRMNKHFSLPVFPGRGSSCS